MQRPWQPDIVVGIDVGQTCSGVAYSIGPDWSEPRTLNHWPSADGVEKADKVATRVGYDARTGELVNWGFQSVFGDANVHVYEQFKLTLEADYEDDRGYTCEHARKWFGDYLRCLHDEIVRFFEASIPTWREKHVEYNFSTPTTWNNPAMIASIEKIVKQAGFEGPKQSVRMSLTEAEAAAIEASTTQYKVGDVFLICDAGGGTTDVNLLKVKSTRDRIALEPLDHVEGVAIGSTLIDFRMAQHIVSRLEVIQEHLQGGDILTLAEDMLMDRFQLVKHSFPRPLTESFWLDVQGLNRSQSFPEVGITDGRMSIDRRTLHEIFDAQIDQIFGLIDEKLLALQDQHPQDQVAYIILSGGLGSSPYLYEQIKKRYEEKVGFNTSNTANIRIMRVLEPQLAVVRGLVRDRTQNLGSPTKGGQMVFETRRSRNSYGTVVREPYNQAAHLGLPFITSPHDGRQWVESVVDWLVKRGDEIKVGEGFRREYGATLTEEEARKPRKAQIVMSDLPNNRLPVLATDQGCKKVATVEYKLTDNDMKVKNGKAWSMKKRYWKADFAFVTMPGAADLRFQISGRNGILSSGHDSLQIEFEDSTEPPMSATLKNGRNGGFDMAYLYDGRPPQATRRIGHRAALEEGYQMTDDYQDERHDSWTNGNGHTSKSMRPIGAISELHSDEPRSQYPPSQSTKDLPFAPTHTGPASWTAPTIRVTETSVAGGVRGPKAERRQSLLPVRGAGNAISNTFKKEGLRLAR